MFCDVTDESGVNFTYRNGEEANHYTILESLGGGVALLDYDGDGRLDIFLTGGGHFGGTDGKQILGYPSRLYRNLGNWKFQDVTHEIGLAVLDFYTHGAAVEDYDRDGWPDLLVTGYGRLALFHNESDGRGGRHFVEVTRKAGLRKLTWPTSAAWGDLMGNGFADLYICQYVDWSMANHHPCTTSTSGAAHDVCPPQQFQPLPHALYRNNGDGTFREVTGESKLRHDGKGLGVLLTDLNDDGRPDLYVANDATDNFLYLNRGAGQFEEKGLRAGVAVDEHGVYNGSMGVDAADYDGSGRPSLWVTNFQGEWHALYRNLGEEQFHHHSQAAGIGALGQQFVGFGTAFVDVDNDGWEDLFIANGHVLRHPAGASARQRPVLMQNVERQGRRFFKDSPSLGGPYFRTSVMGRGVAVGDLDDDGWPDLIVSHANAPVSLLRNEGGRKEANSHWLGIRLIGRNRRPVAGATVTLEVGNRRLTRFVKGGGSYLSSSDRRLLFGLGSSLEVGTLRVRWPWGSTERWKGLKPDQYWEIREGEKLPQRFSSGKGE